MSDPWAEFSPAPPRNSAVDPWSEFQPRDGRGSDGITRLTVRPQVAIPQMDAMGNPGGGMPDDVDVPEMRPSRLRDQLDDITKGVGGGLVRGTAGLIGMVTETAPNALVASSDWLAKKVTGEARPTSKDLMLPQIGEAISTKGIQRGIESVAGSAYEPTTRAGRFASTAAEFVPGAMIGSPANLARNALTFGVVPGLASEAAGQAVEGSAAEPWARGGAALAAGVGGALAQRAGSAERILQNNARGVSHAELDQMENLVQQARQEGINLSRAEALQHVTEGRTQLGELQKRVEGMGGIRDFYSQRPAQNEAAARRSFDTLAPAPGNPSAIGREVGEAAQGTIDDVQGAINRHTRPLYQAAEQQRIDPQTFAQVSRDPVFQEGLQRVRNDPFIGPTLRGLPDDSVQVVDAIKKQLDETGRNLRSPGAGTARNNYAASIVDQGNNRMVAAADRATGSVPGVQGSYEAARAQQSQARQQYLQPLLDGPLGKIANRDQTVKQAIEVLFPANPLPGSQAEIATAIAAVAQRNPWAARQLVRAHAEMTFNEAAQRLTSGPNQGGGAKFAAIIRGNSEQAANLRAAVEAGIPNGQQTWEGFDRFLTIMEAQQRRVPIGSGTSFNDVGIGNLKSGGLANNVAQIIATGGVKLPQKAMSAIQDWNLGRNLDQVANLLTSPEAAQRFRQLVTAAPGSSQFTALATRLIYLATSGRGQREPTRVTIPVGQNLR